VAAILPGPVLGCRDCRADTATDSSTDDGTVAPAQRVANGRPGSAAQTAANRRIEHGVVCHGRSRYEYDDPCGGQGTHPGLRAPNSRQTSPVSTLVIVTEAIRPGVLFVDVPDDTWFCVSAKDSSDRGPTRHL
jgi:hypothetical protein